MLKIRSNKQGFSLIELLVTISIIGILAAVAVPAYNTYKKDAKIGVLQTTTNVVAGALRTCLALKDVTGCDEFDNLQVKHESGKITIGGVSGAASVSSTTPKTICYDIKSTIGSTGFHAKANGCVDSTGTQAFCKWNSTITAITGATATTGAICTSGTCTSAVDAGANKKCE